VIDMSSAPRCRPATGECELTGPKLLNTVVQFDSTEQFWRGVSPYYRDFPFAIANRYRLNSLVFF